MKVNINKHTISLRLQSILLGCLLCLGLLASCKSDDETAVVDFGTDKEELDIPEGGSTETLVIQAADDNNWTSSIDQPWVQMTPANGSGTTNVAVKVDNSVRDSIRRATIRLMDSRGNVKNVQVVQSGHKLSVSPEKKDTTIANAATLDNRKLKIKVTTNVDFDVKIVAADGSTTTPTWITFDKSKLKVNLEYDRRPVTLDLSFDWDINTDKERKAKITFTPKGVTDAKDVLVDTLTVTQQGAPEITDDRAGDSLALITIAQRLGNMTWDTSQKLDLWDNVTVWEPNDEEVVNGEVEAGRVRSARFSMINTKETIPFEVTKLKYVETLAFTSNQNAYLLKIALGTYLNGLKHLKYVSFMGYGIADISELKSASLEHLELNSNTLTEIPANLTPANFPNLKTLMMNSNRITSTMNMQNKTEGLKFELMKDETQTARFLNLLAWEKLDTLQLGVNYISGRMPTKQELQDRGFTDTWKAGDTFIDYDGKEHVVPDNAHIVGQPKILAKTRMFSINLNFLTGTLPDWLLYHPHLYDWNPFTFIFNEEDGYLDNGKKPGFDNTPTNLNYYYEVYPFRNQSTDTSASKTRLHNIRRK